MVTGGAGFIGSNLVDRLVAAGSEVVAIDNLSTGRKSNLKGALAAGARLTQIDIRDSDALVREVAAFAPDLLFHLAAQIDVRTSMSDPGHDASVNVLGSVNVFDAAVRAGVRRVINTSTGGAIYGDANIVPTPETEPCRPVAAYGLSKRTAEKYADWFRTVHALDVLTLRYGNVYGPRQDPAGDAGVIAIFCDHILNGRAPVVFGDGHQSRDFVFVSDIVAANLLAAHCSSPRFTQYNIGTGVEVSVRQLVAATSAAIGVDPTTFEPTYKSTRIGELQRNVLDVTRARDDLGFRSATTLTEGLRRTLEWIRDTFC